MSANNANAIGIDHFQRMMEEELDYEFNRHEMVRVAVQTVRDTETEHVIAL